MIKCFGVGPPCCVASSLGFTPTFIPRTHCGPPPPPSVQIPDLRLGVNFQATRAAQRARAAYLSNAGDVVVVVTQFSCLFKPSDWCRWGCHFNLGLSSLNCDSPLGLSNTFLFMGHTLWSRAANLIHTAVSVNVFMVIVVDSDRPIPLCNCIL